LSYQASSFAKQICLRIRPHSSSESAAKLDGLGDIFAEKHTLAGNYFLMNGNGGEEPNYYLFLPDHSRSGSITGPLQTIGWNQNFILTQNAHDDWNVFAIDPARRSVPAVPFQKSELIESLRKTVTMRPAKDIWALSR